MKTKGIVGEAATLVSGNVLAQVITLLAYFVLTRIYTPEDYGLFNIFNAAFVIRFNHNHTRFRNGNAGHLVYRSWRTIIIYHNFVKK